MTTHLEMLMWVEAAAAALMFLLWLGHFPMRNAAIVDVGWSASFTVSAGVFYLLGQGAPLRKALIAAMVATWSLRLASFLLFQRILGHEEEGRYKQLRENWKTNLGFKFFVFFQAQALTAAVLCIAFVTPFSNASPDITVLEWLGVALWAVALAGEATADRQLAGFKADPKNRGTVCQVGLWNYSRHPNYFFESLIWLAYLLFSLGSPDGAIAAIGPAIILFTILRVTGIPATEAQAVRSRGDAYRRYQDTTSAFVPWFPKKAP
jgi:steroid 5-alpha reductase family enzyme